VSKIRDIEIVPLVFAPPVPYGSARGLAKTRGGSLVLLRTEDGVAGIGEAWGPPAVTRACLGAIKPFYLGQSVFARQGAVQCVPGAMPSYPRDDAVPYPPLPEYDVGHNDPRNAIFTEPIRLDNGVLPVPTSPGLR